MDNNMVKVKIVNQEGKEVEIGLYEKDYNMFFPQPQKKKTGYEHVDDANSTYYYVTITDYILPSRYSSGPDSYEKLYKVGNVYTSQTLAEDNARADRLMRLLRRYAVEHRVTDLDWNDIIQDKWYIHYNHKNHKDHKLDAVLCKYTQTFLTVYFDSKETANDAIDEFHDELLWYFTKYKDSL